MSTIIKLTKSSTSNSDLDIKFKEFIPIEYTEDDLFDIYLNLFYDIEKTGINSHTTIMESIESYVGWRNLPNLNIKEIDDLREQINELKDNINSIEDEHPFIKNNTVIQVRDNPEFKFYIQSGRKRQINNKTVFQGLKTRYGFGKKDDKDFVIILDTNAISNIPSSSPINDENDLNISVSDINTYVQTNNEIETIKNLTINNNNNYGRST